jgi:hypothetical protein
MTIFRLSKCDYLWLRGGLTKMQKIPDFFEKPRTHSSLELTPEKRNIFYNSHDEDNLQANGSTLLATPRRQKRKDWTKEIIFQK